MGRGELSRARGEKRGLRFGSGGNNPPSLELLPARVNRISDTGSLERMQEAFAERHEGESIEYAVILDANGYATAYYEGSTGSVNFPTSAINGKHVLHNHPKGGWAILAVGIL